MTDINLLQDREAGEQKDDIEKQKRKSTIVVELTNPKKERATDSTKSPKAGVLAFLKRLFGSPPPAMPSAANRPPRILHQEPEEPKRKERPGRPREPTTFKQRLTERFVREEKGKEQESALDDVFAPPPGTPPSPLLSPKVIPPSEVIPRLPKQANKEQIPPQPAAAAGPGVTALPPSPEPSLGVNLVPEEMLGSAAGKNRLVSLGFVALLAALVVALGYIGMVIYQNRIVDETETIRTQIAAVDGEIKKQSAAKKTAMDFHAAANNVLGLLDRHIYWTRFLSGLETYTIRDVFYRNITVDRAGHLSIIASAKDYRAVARQLLAFQDAKDFIKDVSITAAQAAKENNEVLVNFAVSITLQDDVLLRDRQGGPPFNQD